MRIPRYFTGQLSQRLSQNERRPTKGKRSSRKISRWTLTKRLKAASKSRHAKKIMCCDRCQKKSDKKSASQIGNAGRPQKARNSCGRGESVSLVARTAAAAAPFTHPLLFIRRGAQGRKSPGKLGSCGWLLERSAPFSAPAAAGDRTDGGYSSPPRRPLLSLSLAVAPAANGRCGCDRALDACLSFSCLLCAPR